jgi:hypothetical protein
MATKHRKYPAPAKTQKGGGPARAVIISPYHTPQCPCQGRITRTVLMIRQREFMRGKPTAQPRP